MQTRRSSLIEACTNIGVGFILSLVVWQLLSELYGYDMPLSRNVEITTVFTVVSLIRSYYMRRAFNWMLTRN